MNYPCAFFALFGFVFLLAACPAERPSDPEPGPADGDTEGEICEERRKVCEVKLERVEAELAECRAPK